jgi:hypothetical protein
VTAEPKRVLLRFDADQRFAVGIGGAARCLAEIAGLQEEACRKLQEATIAACLDTFKADDWQPQQVEILRYDDRIEVVFASRSSGSIRLSAP